MRQWGDDDVVTVTARSSRLSTRKLIIAALVCGLAILLAGALQFVQIAQAQHASSTSGASSAPATP